ncbi:hypothetical protein MKX08_002991 [Trichoderma sp. CBMAI-0020]|nr:hypothetical protein MKX08_002991 [Trichoderma sp. CBMAI-0020]
MATDIDEQSLRLAQDAAALIKGKQRGRAATDVEFAAELSKFELQSLHTFYSDRALCHRLGDLGLEDGDLRDRAIKAQQATNKPKSTVPDEIASARSSESSTPATGASANIVAKETTKETAKERPKRKPNNPMGKLHRYHPAKISLQTPVPVLKSLKRRPHRLQNPRTMMPSLWLTSLQLHPS